MRDPVRADSSLSGFESLVVIKETQAFSQVLSLNADNFLATPTVGLINAPDWVQLKQIDETRFVIDGVSPLGSTGLYAINLEVLGDASADDAENSADDVIC